MAGKAGTHESNKPFPLSRFAKALRRLLGCPRKVAPRHIPQTPKRGIAEPRIVVLDPNSPVRIGHVAAERILRATHLRSDPLGICNELGGSDRPGHLLRVAELARAALEGGLVIGPEQPRAWMHPMTSHMLRLAQVDADGFAALAAAVTDGLYIDGPDGYTIAKAVQDNRWSCEGDERTVHVRVRVVPWDGRPRLVWWQEWDRSFRLAVPQLPATIANNLVGRRLDSIMELPEGMPDLEILEISDHEVDGYQGEASVIKLGAISENCSPS